MALIGLGLAAIDGRLLDACAKAFSNPAKVRSRSG
jgi:hypothetical protein